MHDAIYAQPGALRLVGRDNGAALGRAVARLREVDQVVLTGVGSSWYAALAGELLFARAGGLGDRVRAIHAFEWTRYGPPPATKSAAIVLSHGGGTSASRDALARAKAAGAATIAITARDAGGLGDADVVLTTGPREASSTHTLGYTTAVALLATLAAELGDAGDLRHDLQAIPDQFALLLGQESWEELAARHRFARRWWVVGAGPSRATAYEGAMKLGEAAWVAATGLEAEQFLHGPWAALEPDDVVIVVAPPGPSHARCLDAARVAKTVGAPVLALAREDDREMGALATEIIALPEGDEWLSPITAVVPLQLIAYHVAVARGINPDLGRADQPAHGRARATLTL